MGLDAKSSLDGIIAKIDEKYEGEFTEGDKVWGKAFGTAAQDSYLVL